ncbi:MAG: ABC transporter permease [Planctomycetes bacterium]|nr:ABC transporter permease [Planctomycetota bacterium]
MSDPSQTTEHPSTPPKPSGFRRGSTLSPSAAWPLAWFGRTAVVTQMVRVGVRSILIVCLVSACVGLILALQLAPPSDEYGSREAVANIIGVAILRELGPLIGSIVLTGFAGASIAAEIGTMAVSVLALDIPRVTYIENTLQQAKMVDFLTGVAKAGIFGLLVGTIACANGLKLVGTSSGADGVGRSTTATVVQCIVAITIADLIFTAIFFALKLT